MIRKLRLEGAGESDAPLVRALWANLLVMASHSPQTSFLGVRAEDVHRGLGTRAPPDSLLSAARSILDRDTVPVAPTATHDELLRRARVGLLVRSRDLIGLKERWAGRGDQSAGLFLGALQTAAEQRRCAGASALFREWRIRDLGNDPEPHADDLQLGDFSFLQRFLPGIARERLPLVARRDGYLIPRRRVEEAPEPLRRFLNDSWLPPAPNDPSPLRDRVEPEGVSSSLEVREVLGANDGLNEEPFNDRLRARLRALEQMSPMVVWRRYELAVARALLGDVEGAMDGLRMLLEDQSLELVHLEYDVVWDGFRDHPAMGEMIAALYVKNSREEELWRRLRTVPVSPERVEEAVATCLAPLG